MTDQNESPYRGIVPYVFYDDAEAAIEWLVRVFGFEERGTWKDDQGRIQNAELRVGDTEIWLDGGGRPKDSKPVWIGIWVDDVDAMYRVVQAAGVDAPAPVQREFGVQMLTVTDPEGTLWGFIKRTSGST